MKFSADWIDSGGALERSVELPSFRQAMVLVNRVADLAEAENHHPDLSLIHI